jgi:AcrR family transcriptional regulator
LELYVDRGFEHVTVAEIAERAGLTERTFFRYFTDKREVLFPGPGAVEGMLAELVAAAPRAAAPIEAVESALEAVGAFIQERGEWSRQRHAVISANAELRERELIKMESWASALATALRRRGVKAPAARLGAEAGIAALRVAFEQWVQQPARRNLPRLIHQAFDQLKAVAAGT